MFRLNDMQNETKKQYNRTIIVVCMLCLVVLVTIIANSIGTYVIIKGTRYKPTCSLKTNVNQKAKWFVNSGNISNGPENTIYAIETVEPQYGLKIDAVSTKDEQPICSRYTNLLPLTGNDILTESLLLSDALTIQLLDVIDGINYWNNSHEQSYLMELSRALEKFCHSHETNDSSLSLYVNHRTSRKLWPSSLSDFESRFINNSILTTRKSSCYDQMVNESTNLLVFGSNHPSIVNALPSDDANVLRALVFDPNTLLFNEFVWLQVPFLHYWSQSQTVQVHLSIYKQNRELIQTMRKNGFCVGIHGGTYDELLPFDNETHYLIFDVLPPNASKVLLGIDQPYTNRSNKLMSLFALVYLGWTLCICLVMIVCLLMRDVYKLNKIVNEPHSIQTPYRDSLNYKDDPENKLDDKKKTDGIKDKVAKILKPNQSKAHPSDNKNDATIELTPREAGVTTTTHTFIIGSGTHADDDDDEGQKKDEGKELLKQYLDSASDATTHKGEDQKEVDEEIKDLTSEQVESLSPKQNKNNDSSLSLTASLPLPLYILPLKGPEEDQIVVDVLPVTVSSSSVAASPPS